MSCGDSSLKLSVVGGLWTVYNRQQIQLMQEGTAEPRNVQGVVLVPTAQYSLIPELIGAPIGD